MNKSEVMNSETMHSLCIAGVDHISIEQAEDILELMKTELRNDIDSNSSALLRKLLICTSETKYIRALPNEDARMDWSQTALATIRALNYSFRDLLEDRTNELGDKVLFIDLSRGKNSRWSFAQVNRRARETAAAFYSLTDVPRVAILSENSFESALCDIACLAWDILVSPLNVHFTAEELKDIFERMQFNLVITDSIDRIKKLEELKKQTGMNFQILTTNDELADLKNYLYLPQYCKKLNNEDIEIFLSNRRKMKLNEVCTVMFTSGSTGKPKGVSFSNYNLVSKRFARAAALPMVGEHEVLLCFLPLFHTFGRYLEMMGMIYWRGTYVFAGNASAETLLSLFPKINPTGFISVPIRWVQLFEKAQEAMENQTSAHECHKAFVSVVGTNLRWGLSAAGYLDPKIFKFFHRNGVELSSGFGMTEATGGITMTPPSDYHENTVGKPLPGMNIKLSENGEMLIAGDYVARYLDDCGPGDIIPYPQDTEQFVPTGDIFKVNKSGFYEIIDRIKDIYKNNKGQTVAPRNVEMKYEGVPGIKRTFLVGDGRAYNVLFIVPDTSDSVMNEGLVGDKADNYYQSIITAANKELAPYERVINYSVLNRDFELDKGELTPKGSYNRKNIERHFSDVIESLYKKNYIELKIDGIKIIIPRWVYRDLGLLENHIDSIDNALLDTQRGLRLRIKKLYDNKVKIGNLIYEVNANEIDLGLLSLQPMLWAGNPELMAFAPCKDGWDFSLKYFGSLVLRDYTDEKPCDSITVPDMPLIRNRKLLEINTLICNVMFVCDDTGLPALETIGDYFRDCEERLKHLIRRRLQALAFHKDEETRCLAYRILLQDEPTEAYADTFPTFMVSGLPFLNERSIKIIAESNFESRRLSALRRRLLFYRKTMDWPAGHIIHKQFEDVFKLLTDFVERNPDYYAPVRVEIVDWIMHKADPVLSTIAGSYFNKLSEAFEAKLGDSSPAYFKEEWLSKITFDLSLSKREISQLKEVLVDTTFLKQSIMLAFEEPNFDLNDIGTDGIWISRINSWANNYFYRVSINTIKGRHYDLQMVVGENLDNKNNLELVLWLISITGYPYGPTVMPRLGCARTELNARSLVFHDELNVWEKIKELSAHKKMGRQLRSYNILRKLFTEAMAAYFRIVRNSDFKIIPGLITPNNSVVPEIDFSDGAIILSLAGMKKYKNTLSVVEPLYKEFYRKCVHCYSWIQPLISVTWMFDAVCEAFEERDALNFFKLMLKDLNKNDIRCLDGSMLSAELAQYLEMREQKYMHPLALVYAIDKYHEWYNMNPQALPSAKEQTVTELFNLYRLNRYPEIARYELYYHTYFEDKNEVFKQTFEKLLFVMNRDKNVPASHLIELSDLQGLIMDSNDRDVFSRMVFPGINKQREIDFLKIVEKNRRELIVQTKIYDKMNEAYQFREPIEPAEIGLVYRLFYKEKLPRNMTESDQFFVLLDSQQRIVGGISYKMQPDYTVLLDGIVIASQLKSRGLGRMMMEDFIHRMNSLGIDVIKTNFFLKDFYLKLGFTTDKRWGMMVKILNEEKFKE